MAILGKSCESIDSLFLESIISVILENGESLSGSKTQNNKKQKNYCIKQND